jgi:hypothetical protein
MLRLARDRGRLGLQNSLHQPAGKAALPAQVQARQSQVCRKRSLLWYGRRRQVCAVAVVSAQRPAIGSLRRMQPCTHVGCDTP